MTELLGTTTVYALRQGAFLRGAAQAFDPRGITTRQYRMFPTAGEADRHARVADLTAVVIDRLDVLDAE